MDKIRPRSRPLYVYKLGGSWWWQCRVPFCQLNDCGAGHEKTLQDALEHVNKHGKLGFRKGK